MLSSLSWSSSDSIPSCCRDITDPSSEYASSASDRTMYCAGWTTASFSRASSSSSLLLLSSEATDCGLIRTLGVPSILDLLELLLASSPSPCSSPVTSASAEAAAVPLPLLPTASTSTAAISWREEELVVDLRVLREEDWS